MTMTFDSVLVAVPDLEAAVAGYEILFDCTLERQPCESGARQACLGVANTTIILEEREAADAAVARLVFCDPGHEGPPQQVANSLDLDIGLCGPADSTANRVFSAAPGGVSVDHVVLRTNDPQGCIDLFGVGLGVRLALDKTVEQWGGRMLFFRAGKMTLEVIANDDVEASSFWGIAYRCDDIEAFSARLKTLGVDISEVRDGRKPGTRVATIKSHCLGIPTLLIEQIARD